MSYQMCTNFINVAFNNIPLNKCYPNHLQLSEPSFNFQDLSTYFIYILFIFIFLLILYTNLRNTLILTLSNLSTLKHSLLPNLIYFLSQNLFFFFHFILFHFLNPYYYQILVFLIFFIIFLIFFMN
jgi:hypothetical protein